MRTHTVPWDYKRRTPVISQLESLCANCGYWSRGNCVKCGGMETIQVYEYEAQDFRETLAAGRYMLETLKTAIEFIYAEPDKGIDEIDAEWLNTDEEGSDISLRAQLREAGYGEDGRL